jgi:hypothetical protein
MMTFRDIEELCQRADKDQAEKEGLNLFGRKILGGGVHLFGRTFYFGTHRSSGQRWGAWLRP